MLAVVEDLGQGDDDADDDADNDENERTGEGGHVDTARFVDVQRRVEVRDGPFSLRHVPALTAVSEPVTLQCLGSSRTNTTFTLRACHRRLTLRSGVRFISCQ